MRAKTEILNAAAPTAANTISTEVEAKFAVENLALLEELAISPNAASGYCLAIRSRKSRRTYISTRKIIICCVRAISCGCAPAKTIGRSAAARLYKDYFLEFVGSLLEGESGAIVAFLKSLQEDLGDLQDAVVSKQLLGDGDSDDGHVIARYEAAQDKVIAKLRRETREDFAQFVGEENRRRLLCAIANL